MDLASLIRPSALIYYRHGGLFAAVEATKSSNLMAMFSCFLVQAPGNRPLPSFFPGLRERRLPQVRDRAHAPGVPGRQVLWARGPGGHRPPGRGVACDQMGAFLPHKAPNFCNEKCQSGYSEEEGKFVPGFDLTANIYIPFRMKICSPQVRCAMEGREREMSDYQVIDAVCGRTSQAM